MTESVTRNFVLATRGRRRTPVDAGMPFLPTSMSARFLYVDHAGRLVLHPLMFELPFFAYGPSFQSVKYGALGGEIADVLSSLVFTRIAELDAEFSSRATKIPCVAGKYRPSSGHQIDAVDLQFLRRATSLRFLYEAFKHLDLPETAPLHLKSHAKLTEVQIFFFFWCFIQCGMEYANTMCNEVLGGFDRFAVAYKCDERSAMASSQQCDLFSLSEPALSAKREERNVTGTFSIL
ncbi:hypothetical protein HPB50_021330 [Hyalomma asiaticum]|uniref:Uncharacterized protein n=1 Tax=Hyalomma asiaticum TaxID=266040 RepID=A0ACB7SAS0_HYAAI|nr:hypothetical protein HPB50_021330 [Hyalomma asiaticum]